MSDRRLAYTVRQIRRIARPAGDPADDRTLLSKFAASHDEAAFAELVRRHGPLVLGVCRRVLGDIHTAEDVFQATFLTLARKAGTVRWRPAIGPWLYAVAYRLARKMASRERKRPEFHSKTRPPVAYAPGSPDPAVAAAWAELRRILDDELAGLPDRLRSPLVLCYLDGQTRDEAAAILGWSLAMLKRRLERGRSLLRKRLEARGVTAGLLAAAVEAIPVPAGLRAATAEAAATLAATGNIIGPVAALLDGGTTMVGAKTALTVSVLLLTGVVAVLASGVALAPRGPAQPPDKPVLGADPRAANPTQPSAATPTKISLPPGAVARLGTLAFCHGDGVLQILTSPDGRSIITVGVHAVRIWDAESGREDGTIYPPKDQRFNSASLLPGGDQLALGCLDVTIHIWDWKTCKEVRSFKPELSGPAIGPGAYAIAPDGRMVGSAAYAFTPDGRRAMLLYQSGISPMVDLTSGKITEDLSGHDDAAISATFTSDGKTAITAGQVLRIWDVATGKQQRQLPSPFQVTYAVAVSPDGRWLAVCGAARK